MQESARLQSCRVAPLRAQTAMAQKSMGWLTHHMFWGKPGVKSPSTDQWWLCASMQLPLGLTCGELSGLREPAGCAWSGLACEHPHAET